MEARLQGVEIPFLDDFEPEAPEANFSSAEDESFQRAMRAAQARKQAEMRGSNG